MALIGSLISVSPNCTGANLAITLTNDDGTPDVLGSIYLVQGTEETKIYQSTSYVGTGAENATNWLFNIEQLIDTSWNELYNADDDELDALIESITNLNGLYKFVMTVDSENGEVKETYVLGTCAIDCCMANLLSTVINCNCEGGDCHDVIRKIEKILILIRCAVVDAANGNIAAAQEKYNKAAELCDSTCDCNC